MDTFLITDASKLINSIFTPLEFDLHAELQVLDALNVELKLLENLASFVKKIDDTCKVSC